MGIGRGRGKLLAGLVVLGAVWAFAAFATGGDVARLFQARAIGDQLGKPADVLIAELQAERRLSTAWLGGSTGRSGADRRAALAAQRARTDQARAALDDSAGGAWAGWVAGADAGDRADALRDRLAGLAGIRAGVDGRKLDREHAAAEYTGVIDVAFRIYDLPRVWSDPHLGRRQDALVTAARAGELLAREDALVRGALAAGGLTDTERGRLAQLAGARRFLDAEARATLPAADLARYRDLAADPRFAALRDVEDRLARPPTGTRQGGKAATTTGGKAATTTGGKAATAPGTVPGIEAEWTGPADTVLTRTRELIRSGSRETVDAATPAGVGTILRAGLIGGLGLIALIAVVMMTLRASRGTGPGATADGATAGAGGTAGGATSGAGGTAGGTGPGAATGAELHALLLDLNRRNQALLHRQLRVLDAMERREADDEDLGDLFRADHLATRIRRNVEKLIALAGGAPGRRWRSPVPMVDVVRAAAAEVAEYPRVAAAEIEPVALAGMAVADVSHLLAELMENATTFSPAQTRVRVHGARCDDGYLVSVTDSGPGMPEDDLATAREVLAQPDPPAGGVWWGLYAVGRLADRHGITVTFSNELGGGLTAEVIIPSVLLAQPGAADTDGADAFAAAGDGHAGDAFTVDSGGDEPPEEIRLTASGLPTRVRNATEPPPESTVRPRRPRADLATDRVARLRKRAQAGAETMELPVTPGGPDHGAVDQQSTVGQPGRKSS